DLGNIGTSLIEDAFNSDGDQSFAMTNDNFVRAVQNGEDKLWQWIGGVGNFGNSATVAIASYFVDLTDGGVPIIGQYIPLAGTEVGSPVTGDIEIEGGYTEKGFVWNFPDEDIAARLYFSDFGVYLTAQNTAGTITSFIDVRKDGIQITNNDASSKGLYSNQYFGANYDDNTYVQKKYVDDNFAPVSGVVLESDYNANTIL